LDCQKTRFRAPAALRRGDVFGMVAADLRLPSKQGEPPF
jgi:hypothetical protein